MQCKHERAHVYAVTLSKSLRDEASRDVVRRSEPSQAQKMAAPGESRGDLDHGIGRYLERRLSNLEMFCVSNAFFEICGLGTFDMEYPLGSKRTLTAGGRAREFIKSTFQLVIYFQIFAIYTVEDFPQGLAL